MDTRRFARQNVSYAMAHLTWEHDGALIAVERGLIMTRWTGPPTARQLEALANAHERSGRSVAILDAVVDLRGRPCVDDAVRAQLMRLIRSHDARTVGVAHVVTLGGLAGTAVRSFFGAIEMVSGTRTPTATFDDVRAAAPWLARKLGMGWSSAEVLAAWSALPPVHPVMHGASWAPDARGQSGILRA